MHWLSTFLRKLFTIRDQQETDVQKPFLDHLEDLRVTLFKMAAALAVGMAIAFWFNQQLMDIVQAPLNATGLTLVTGGFTDGIMVSLKLSFYAGLVISFPALLYFVAEFILPALTRREKRMLYPGVLISFALFGLGVWISYRYLVPRTIIWLKEFNERRHFINLPQAGTYFSFVSHLSIACGLLAELPIVVITLALFGIVSYDLLSRTRAYAMVLIGILVAVLSPTPDPITFAILVLPVMAVYELCIWIVWLIERRKARIAG